MKKLRLKFGIDERIMILPYYFHVQTWTVNAMEDIMYKITWEMYVTMSRCQTKDKRDTVKCNGLGLKSWGY